MEINRNNLVAELRKILHKPKNDLVTQRVIELAAKFKIVVLLDVSPSGHISQFSWLSDMVAVEPQLAPATLPVPQHISTPNLDPALYQRCQEMIEELSKAPISSADLLLYQFVVRERGHL